MRERERLNEALLSNWLMLHKTIGKILQQRYKIVESLGSSHFGQTYLAFDLKTPLHTQCVIKRLKSPEPNDLEATRLRFATELEMLQRLEKHDGIAQIIAAFEEDEQFYLVRELISGHSLTAELPINQRWGHLWNESEVVEFLQYVLGILEFVHLQGIVHCDLKPDNLIRRAEDGKLFLTDFGSLGLPQFEINPLLPIFRIAITSLGYTPPEQFHHQVHPSSDIYALGMIAIQGLTGLSPMQLKQEPQTNQVIWRFTEIQVSDQIAAVLDRMICHDFRERYQSAGEVLQSLQNLWLEVTYAQVETRRAEAIKILDSVHPTLNPDQYNQEYIIRENPQPSSRRIGMKIALAANSLVLGFSAYALLNNSVTAPKNTLYKATEQYQTGNLDKAIALAKSIPPESSIYPEAQTTIQDWNKEWKIAAQQFQVVEKAFNQSRWADVLIASHQVPDILYWQTKTDKLVKQAKPKIELVAQKLLNKAYNSAEQKDFSTALSYLQQIPQESSAGMVVKEKLAEYSKKQQIKAVHLLQLAYNKAETEDFTTAIKIIKQIPQETDTYATAQLKLAEYTEKHRQQIHIATGTYLREVNVF